MLSVSNKIKNAYNSYTTQRKSYIRVGNNSFFIQNLDVNADAYDEGNIIGNAIAKIAKFDIETANVHGISEFELFDGIWTGNQYEYISLGTFTLFEEKGVDDFFSSVTAYDKLIKFNKKYDPSIIPFPISMYNFTKKICEQADIVLLNQSLPNGDKILTENIFVENETLKKILNAICQINGCFGIVSQDKLKLLLKGTDTIYLEKYQLSKTESKRTTWKWNQLVLGMSNVDGEYVMRQDLDDIARNGVHKLVINDNPFVYTQALREEYIDNLFNQIKGFGYVAFETEWEGLSYIELGDLVNLDGKESIVLRYNLKSPNGLNSTLSAPSIIDSVVEYVDNSSSLENRMQKTEYQVDKANGLIRELVSKTTIVANTINSVGSVRLENAHVGLLHKLSFYGDISLIFPSRDLYPDYTLYPRGSYLLIDDKEYKLDFDILRYYSSEIYDEFVYEDGNCYIIRRVGLSVDGERPYPLEEEVIEPRKSIYLEVNSNSVIKLKSFDNAIYSVEYLLENDYTNNFASQVEMKSEIALTNNKIEATVKEIADDDGEVTAASLILAINKDESNAEINADKISLKGKKIDLSADDVSIGGDVLSIDNKGKMELSDNAETYADMSNFKITSKLKEDRYNTMNSIGNYLVDGVAYYSHTANSFQIYDEQGIDGRWQSIAMETIYSYEGKYVPHLVLSDGTRRTESVTNITSRNIQTPVLTQTSLASQKKDFEKLESGLEIVKSIDIYKYHLKNQDDKSKKHIGFVIGKDFNYSKEITSEKNDGVDLYSFVSVCCKAIQEQQQEIENLKKEMEELKNAKN